MSAIDFYLLCFVFGLLWSVVALFAGSFHLHGHGFHGHVHSAHLHGHAGGAAHAGHSGAKMAHAGKGWDDLFNIHTIALFLAWFGGCGYLMSRHSSLALSAVLAVSCLIGLAGAAALGIFMRFLSRREHAMDPADYDMVGVLGKISSAIHANGTGEILFARDGARRLAYARSDDGNPIERGIEVIVTRYEKGVAYVRTWDTMTSGEALERTLGSS
jgi:membrane protein implicated in regulation of membrane protease activity